MAINSLKEYTPARNAFINARLGPDPQNARLDGSGGVSYDPQAEAAHQQWQQQWQQLAQQFDATLPPGDVAKIRDEEVRSTAKNKKRFQRGKMGTLALIGGVAAGAAAPALAGAFGGAGAAAGGGAAAAGTSALEAQLIAGGMSAAEAASVAAEVAAATAAEGGIASGVGLAAGAGGTAAGAAAGTAAMGGGTLEQLAAKYGPEVGKLLSNPATAKMAMAALPLLAGAGGGGGGGGGGGSGGGSGSGGGGLMGGGVLGSSGLMGSPQEKEAQSYQLAQTRSDWANRPDQQDMYGNKTQWSSHAELDPATGQMVTKWDNKIVLDPQQQQAVDSEKAIKAGMMSNAQGLMGRVGESFAQPMDYSKFQQWGQTPQGDDAARQRMETMLMDRMRPENERAQAGLEGQLAQMGLTRGSDQWNQEMQRLQDQQSRGRFDAFQTAGNEMQNQYSRELQSSNYQNQLRGSQIAETTAQRMQPLTEMNALRQGNQVAAPQFGAFGQSKSSGGIDYSQQYADQTAQQQAGRASTGDALLNIGTTMAGIYYGNQQPQYGPQQTQQPGLMNGGYNAQTGQPKYS